MDKNAPVISKRLEFPYNDRTAQNEPTARALKALQIAG